MPADRLVDQALARVSQNNQFAATVLGVGAAHHQSDALQPIKTIGHAAKPISDATITLERSEMPSLLLEQRAVSRGLLEWGRWLGAAYRGECGYQINLELPLQKRLCAVLTRTFCRFCG